MKHHIVLIPSRENIEELMLDSVSEQRYGPRIGLGNLKSFYDGVDALHSQLNDISMKIEMFM